MVGVVVSDWNCLAIRKYFCPVPFECNVNSLEQNVSTIALGGVRGNCIG